jgi:chitinase
MNYYPKLPLVRSDFRQHPALPGCVSPKGRLRVLLTASAMACTIMFGLAATTTTALAAATGVPGVPNLSPNNYDGDNSVSIIMNMWWGNNGTTWQLFRNGTLVYSTSLTDNSPNAQTATSATFSNLALGTYTFTSKLTNSFGTTTGNTLSYTVTQAGGTGGGGTNPTAPATPTGLTATVNSSSQITVTWSASSGATSYDLQVDGVQKTSVSSPYVDSGLAANSVHTFAVRADNSAGDSAFSSLVSATTQSTTTPVPPATPTGLAATANSSSQITVTWNASSGATSYDLQVDGAQKTGVSSPYVDSGLAASSVHTFAVRADDSAGDSAFSSLVSATTQSGGGGGGGGGSLPEHLITGYYQDFDNGAAVLRLTSVPMSYNLIAVAFATSTGTPGQVTFSVDSGLSSALGGYSQAQFIADIATCEARGQHVILSVGGANGTISVNSSASASAFASSVNSIMSTWGFQGVDIDLENGISPTFMAQALRQLKSGSIITLAPQTIDVQNANSDYLALALSIKDILTICNCQYYNSGTMLGANGQVYAEGTEDFLTALAVIQLQAGLAPSQVGLGLPASTSAAGSGYVSPSVVVNALKCLATGADAGSYHPPTTYPTIRGAMTWSINWDASNGYNFANTVSASFGSL